MGQLGQGFAPENKLTYTVLMNQYAHIWYNGIYEVDITLLSHSYR